MVVTAKACCGVHLHDGCGLNVEDILIAIPTQGPAVMYPAAPRRDKRGKVPRRCCFFLGPFRILRLRVSTADLTTEGNAAEGESSAKG